MFSFHMEDYYVLEELLEGLSWVLSLEIIKSVQSSSGSPLESIALKSAYFSWIWRLNPIALKAAP